MKKPVGVKGLKFCKTEFGAIYLKANCIYMTKPWTRMSFFKNMYKVRNDVLENNLMKIHT